MNPRILEINKNIQSYKEEIVNHPLYKKMNSVEDIAVLMEYHVYAVWDFMSLLKSLQSILTCTSISVETCWRHSDKKVNKLNCFRRGK